MKQKRKLKITIYTTTVLALVALFMIFNNRNSTISNKDTDFAIKDTASITKVFMADKKGNSLLIVRDENAWRLNEDYYVRKDIGNALFETLYKMSVREPVADAAVNNTITQLASFATKVEVYQEVYRVNLFNFIKLFKHEKLTKVFYVGYDAQDNMGTIMMVEGAKRPYVVYIKGFKGVLSTRFLPRVNDWRDLTLFNLPVTKIQEIEVDFPSDTTKSYKIHNNNDRTFSVLTPDNKKIHYFDTVTLLRYVGYFKEVNLSRYYRTNDTRDSLLLLQPFYIIKVTDINGKAIDAKIYRKPYEDLFAVEGKEDPTPPEEKPQWSSNEVYIVLNKNKDCGEMEYWLAEKILRTRDYFN